MITFKMQPNFDDYQRAQRFHGRRLGFVIAGLLAPLAVVLWTYTHDLAVPAFVACYLLIARPLVTRLRLKRCWRQTPSLHAGERIYRLDDVGFHVQGDDGNLVATHWDKFIKFRESKDAFLIYLSPRLFVFVPKRFLSGEDEEQTRELLAARIGKSNERVAS